MADHRLPTPMAIVLAMGAAACGAPPASAGRGGVSPPPGPTARAATPPSPNPTASAEPPPLAGDLGIAQLVVSGAGACARMNDGRVRCFGTGAKVDALAGVVDLASDGDTTCAVLRAGTVHCWGMRPGLRRDDKPSASPHQVPGLTDVADIELDYHGSHFSDSRWCAVSPSGSVRCTCNLGNGRCTSTDAVAIAGAPASVRAFGTTEEGCALTRDKRVWCWNTHQSKSGRVVPELVGVEDLVAYALAWCARSDEGKVFCFGSNHAGQLGRGYITVTGDPDEPPTPPDTPLPLDLRASALAPGLVITTSGELRVWGEQHEGQRKPDKTGDLDRPVDPATVVNARIVAASSDRACAVDDRAQVWCWGLPAPLSPDKPHDLPEVKDAIAIASAKHQVCALRKTGDVACWGRRLDAASETITEPKSLGVTDAVEIAVSPWSSCARARDRRAPCWGGRLDSKGEPLAENVDAIGFLHETLCVSDAKTTRCSSPIVTSGTGKSSALTLDSEALALAMGGKPTPRPKPPALQAAGPGGSRGWAHVRGETCFVRNKGVQCLAGSKDKVSAKAGVTNAIDLADGAVVSAADPSVRVTGPAIRALVGEEQLAVGKDGAIYTYSLRSPAKLTKRSDFAGITDAIDMAGTGSESRFGCVVRRSGQVSCWGSGADGEIGLGNRRLPRVVGIVGR